MTTVACGTSSEWHVADAAGSAVSPWRRALHAQERVPPTEIPAPDGAQGLRRERSGDSSPKTAERHTPRDDAVDLTLKLGGVERESGFKR
jgi:hypothetical protein